MLRKSVTSAFAHAQAGADLLSKPNMSPDERNLAQWIFNNQNNNQAALGVFNEILGWRQEKPIKRDLRDEPDIAIFCDFSRFTHGASCDNTQKGPHLYCDTFYLIDYVWGGNFRANWNSCKEGSKDKEGSSMVR